MPNKDSDDKDIGDKLKEVLFSCTLLFFMHEWFLLLLLFVCEIANGFNGLYTNSYFSIK